MIKAGVFPYSITMSSQQRGELIWPKWSAAHTVVVPEMIGTYVMFVARVGDLRRYSFRMTTSYPVGFVTVQGMTDMSESHVGHAKEQV